MDNANGGEIAMTKGEAIAYAIAATLALSLWYILQAIRFLVESVGGGDGYE